MDSYSRYSKYLVRSVSHIFKNFLEDPEVEEIYVSQAVDTDHKVAVELTGTIAGEIIITIPERTLNQITRKFVASKDSRALKKSYGDVAGELANLITGTFANHLQYNSHNVRLSAPEFNDDPITIKALYENINLSFSSQYGGFDIDFYYRDKR